MVWRRHVVAVDGLQYSVAPLETTLPLDRRTILQGSAWLLHRRKSQCKSWFADMIGRSYPFSFLRSPLKLVVLPLVGGCLPFFDHFCWLNLQCFLVQPPVWLVESLTSFVVGPFGSTPVFSWPIFSITSWAGAGASKHLWVWPLAANGGPGGRCARALQRALPGDAAGDEKCRWWENELVFVWHHVYSYITMYICIYIYL